MQGMELSRGYYEAYGEAMIREQFPELEGLIAIGLCGRGSECFGYDDEISQDHNFEPKFMMFIPGEDIIDTRAEFQLSRAYAKLPKEFEGMQREPVQSVGRPRHGVLRMDDWWKYAIGIDNLSARVGGLAAASSPLTWREWFGIPEYALAEATNGEIFRDDLGVFTNIRKYFRHYPADIRKKKLAGYLLMMQQTGDYNYKRLLGHGEPAAAQLAITEFAKATMHCAFLINDRYMPYYKWAFRSMRALAMLAPLSEQLEFLLTTPNDPETAARKIQVIDEIQKAVWMVTILRGFQGQRNQLKPDSPVNLEHLAYAVNDAVDDGELRNLHIFAGVE